VARIGAILDLGLEQRIGLRSLADAKRIKSPSAGVELQIQTTETMTTSELISIVLADDHPVVLHGVADILRAQADMKVLATCGDGTTAVHAIRELVPDIAVLDIAMPGLNGIEVLSGVAIDPIKTKIVLLTAVATDDQILAAIANGARGIVLKDAAPDSLVDCVRGVAVGKRWYPTDLVESALRRNAGRRENERVMQTLTPREQEIVVMVVEGITNKEIARRIDLTEGTIKIHLHNIYEKLKIPNRTALTAFAIAYENQRCH
jgi:RNA polymerase sigma factor (sigma-70 family)